MSTLRIAAAVGALAVIGPALEYPGNAVADATSQTAQTAPGPSGATSTFTAAQPGTTQPKKPTNSKNSEK